jgi:hypothetical protein
MIKKNTQAISDEEDAKLKIEYASQMDAWKRECMAEEVEALFGSKY